MTRLAHRSVGRWRAMVVACAAVALLQAAPAGAAPVTIGNSLANPNNGSIGCGPPCTVFQENQPGATLVSPFDGTIVAWSYRSTDAGAAYQLRVLHPLGNGQFQGAGSSQPVAVQSGPDTVRGPIAASLPIRAGDRIGLRVVTAPSGGAPLFVSGSAAEGVAYFAPDVADGAAATPAVHSQAQQLLLQATIQPSPPACQDVAASTVRNQAVSIALSCADVAGAPLTYSIAGGPAHGTATLTGASIAYTPAGGYVGTDAITYRASSANGTASPRTVSITITAAPPLPPPVLARSVNLVPIKGRVFVKLPAAAGRVAAVDPLRWAGGRPAWADSFGAVVSAAQPPRGFIPLSRAAQLPVGTLVDTIAGTARLTTATATVGRLQTADFQAGIFRILQNRAQRGLTDLRINDALSARSACRAGAAHASRTLSKRILGLLKGNGHGQFRTRGQFSAATVRGTEWGVRDRCDGTLTVVQRGVVVVDDFRRHRNIVVHAGHTYLARAH